jgi:hypothetical protein
VYIIMIVVGVVGVVTWFIPKKRKLQPASQRRAAE